MVSTKRDSLSKARQDLGYSQGELAKRLGISLEHVRSLEYGRSNPSTALMFKICSELQSTPEVLFKDLLSV